MNDFLKFCVYMIWRWFSSNETVKWSWSDSQGSYGDAVYVLFFASARSSGVDKLKLSVINPRIYLLRVCDWIIYSQNGFVCAELRWMYYDQDIIITEDSVLMPDRVLEKNASPFMDWMAVGFFHLLALGGQTLTTCWRKNFCIIRLFFSFLCIVCSQVINQSK